MRSIFTPHILSETTITNLAVLSVSCAVQIVLLAMTFIYGLRAKIDKTCCVPPTILVQIGCVTTMLYQITRLLYTEYKSVVSFTVKMVWYSVYSALAYVSLFLVIHCFMHNLYQLIRSLNAKTPLKLMFWSTRCDKKPKTYWTIYYTCHAVYLLAMEAFDVVGTATNRDLLVSISDFGTDLVYIAAAIVMTTTASQLRKLLYNSHAQRIIGQSYLMIAAFSCIWIVMWLVMRVTRHIVELTGNNELYLTLKYTDPWLLIPGTIGEGLLFYLYRKHWKINKIY